MQIYIKKICHHIMDIFFSARHERPFFQPAKLFHFPCAFDLRRCYMHMFLHERNALEKLFLHLAFHEYCNESDLLEMKNMSLRDS